MASYICIGLLGTKNDLSSSSGAAEHLHTILRLGDKSHSLRWMLKWNWIVGSIIPSYCGHIFHKKLAGVYVN